MFGVIYRYLMIFNLKFYYFCNTRVRYVIRSKRFVRLTFWTWCFHFSNVMTIERDLCIQYLVFFILYMIKSTGFNSIVPDLLELRLTLTLKNMLVEICMYVYIYIYIYAYILYYIIYIICIMYIERDRDREILQWCLLL